uniref:Uncharacterized protein n=1 Tax=Avena sativa TaxID=4498 RepID=A0ACD5ZHM7_AVESA
MDRPQRRNPSSRPLKPPRPPGYPAFQARPASRPAPEPSSPDGRPRKKVRFASEAGSHHIHATQNAYRGKAEKTKPQGSDAKTTEFKFFKKMWEQSGCRSHSFRQPHQNNAPSISKQKEGERTEPHNVTSNKKFPVQKVTPCPNQTCATPLNNAFSNVQVEMQASHSEHDNHDTPQLKPCDGAPTGHVFTPMIQTPFELAGISRNTEPGSGRMFSEMRRNLLKLASKTVAMESCELLQKRSEFCGDIMQRLGASNIIRKHHKEPMRQREMAHGHTPCDPGVHFINMLDYRGDFNSLSKLRSGKEPPFYANDESRQFLALPWVDKRGLPSFLDWENGLPCGDNDAHQCMPLPSAYTTNLSSSDWKRDTVHNQVSNFLLEDVQPRMKRKSDSANEFGGNIQSEPYDHHGWDPMLSLTFTESVPNRLSLPCQIGEQSVVPYALSNTSWQPELSRSLEHCTSRSVGLEGEDLTEAGLFGNSAAGLLSTFDQSHEKCTSSSFLELRNGVLDNSSFSGISNFNASESNSFMSNPDRGCLNSICSASDYPFEQGSKSFCDPSVRTSCLAGTEEEAELFDNSDTGIVQGMDLIPVAFTASSFSKYSGILDPHHDPKDSNSILPVGADDACLDSLSPYSEHPCEQNWENARDSSTELWSSSHHVQSHGGSLGAMFRFTSNGSICNDVEDDHSFTLVEANPKSGLFGTSDLAFFGSCSTMGSIRETPMLSLGGVRW